MMVRITGNKDVYTLDKHEAVFHQDFQKFIPDIGKH